METAGRIEPDGMAPKLNDGRDELNLAEFPLCALAHRLRPEQKTLRFEDRVWDERRGELITRQLTITGSDAYGLPTALDDEVLLGLIQLSRLRDFADRKVPFTRHQLLQMLGWRDDSKSYARLEASLHRWTGVTLFYQRAWWNKAQQCWMDESFHVLDNVWLCHRDAPAPDTGLAGRGAPASAFVWNEVLFRSFQAGNLKRLDFDFFKELRSAVAKRLYRFLDKRFFHRHRWEFDLKEFAWEHAGLARGYDVANLKRKLRPAIAELERKGYLEPLSEPERFRKVGAGEWRVVFGKAKEGSVPPTAAVPSADHEALVVALTERGVSPSTARATASQYPADQIQAQLEVFDWRRARHDPTMARNPPGFLISAIRGEYAVPKAFLDQAAQTQGQRAAAERRRQREQQRQQLAAARELAEQRRAESLRSFWESLAVPERERLAAEALAQATPMQRRLLARGGSAAAATRQALLDAYALKAGARNR